MDDVPKTLLAAVLAVLTVIALWTAIDRGSRPALAVRAAWSRRSVRRSLCAVLTAMTFAALAEDVVGREQDELVLRLDRHVSEVVRGLASRHGVKTAATLVSGLTGNGLIALAGAAAIGLTLARRRLEATIVVLGTVGAWAVSGVLKVVLGIPRPRAQQPWNPFADFGFPSGHAFVTIVCCGLLAWALARRASPGRRRLMFAGALGLAVVAGSSRLLLNAHWLSDVAGGLLLGTAWVNVVIVFADRTRYEESAAPDLPLTSPLT